MLCGTVWYGIVELYWLVVFVRLAAQLALPKDPYSRRSLSIAMFAGLDQDTDRGENDGRL